MKFIRAIFTYGLVVPVLVFALVIFAAAMRKYELDAYHKWASDGRCPHCKKALK